MCRTMLAAMVVLLLATGCGGPQQLANGVGSGASPEPRNLQSNPPGGNQPVNPPENAVGGGASPAPQILQSNLPAGNLPENRPANAGRDGASPAPQKLQNNPPAGNQPEIPPANAGGGGASPAPQNLQNNPPADNRPDNPSANPREAPTPPTIIAQATGKQGPPPRPKRVLRWADIAAAYKRSFIPDAATYTYSLAGHTQKDNGNIVMMCHQNEPGWQACEMDAQGKKVGDKFDVAKWIPPLNRTCDLLELNGKLHSVSQNWYNGSQTYDNPGFEVFDGRTISDPVRTAGVVSKYSSGWMNEIPPYFKRLGYSFMCADQGSSGDACCRYGPNLNISKYIPGKDYPTRVLMQHSKEHPYTDADGKEWYLGDQLSSLAWIETADAWGLFGIAYRAMSGEIYQYEYDADTWEIRAMIWNPQDIIDVYNGKKPTFGLRPAEEFVLVDVDNKQNSVLDLKPWRTQKGLVAVKVMTSFRNNRLLVVCPMHTVVQTYALAPKVWVFDF